MKYGIIIRNGVSGKPVVKQVHDLDEIRVLEEGVWYKVHKPQVSLCERYINKVVKFIIDEKGMANIVDIVKIPIE